MLAAPPPGAQTNASVLGYYSASDGGGGQFYYDATASSSTNLGTIFKPTSYNGRWLRVFSTPANVKWFGAFPNDAVDDTAATLAAVAYTETQGSGYSLYAPGGTYLLSQPVVLKKSELFGVRTHQSRVITTGNTVFQTTNWNTALYKEVFDISPDGASTGAPWLHDIQIQSSRTNTITKIPITAVASRLSFTIGETPTLQTGNQTNFYPYLNWAFFFSPQGNYMGGGTVRTAVQSGTNWNITITDGDDFYATPVGTGGALTTSCFVTFAPLTTIGGADRSDPTQVGVAGVRMRGSLSAKVENVGTYDTWVGFAFSPYSVTSFHWIKDTAAWRNSFAGYASAVRSYQGAYDYSGDGVLFASGFSPSFDISVDNKGYSAGMFGFYNLPIASGFDQIWSDGYVVGMQSDLVSGIAIDRVKLDNCYRHGLVTLDALYDLGFSTGISIGALDIRGLLSTSDTIPLPNGRAIWMRGKTYPAEIWAGTLTVMLASNQRFDYAIDITNSSANSLTIGRMMTGTGFTNWLPATSRLPVLFSSAYGSTNSAVGWSYNNTIQKNLGASISLANNGTNRLTVNASGVTGYSADGTKTTFVAGDTTFVARGGDTNVYNRTTQNGVYIGRRSAGEPADFSGAFLLESGSSGNVANQVRAAGTAIFDGLASLGTYDAPTPLTGDVSISSFGARAYDGSAYNTAARLQFLTSGTHSSTNRGSYARIETTPFGSTSRSTFYTFGNDGTITVPKGIAYGLATRVDYYGSGSPEGVVTADISSTWRRTDGGASTTFYVKESGSGNTGWVAYGAPGGSGAPSTADYLVKTADGGLSAERVVTDTTSITVDWATGGQAKFVREALTGDVTAAQNNNATTIAAGAVTLAKMANLAQDQFIGRVTASTGVPETTTITSAARSVLDEATTSAMHDALQGAETTVASATTTDLGAVASDKVSITGTTTITGFGTVAAGTFRQGRFTGALTLTHNATSLIVPGGASITTAAGDRFQAYSLGSGNWVVSSYTKADGTAVVGGGGVSDGDKGDITVSGSGATWTIDNDVVSNAKMANMAASTIKARVTGSTGDPEDATLSQVLDLVGSAANGDMLVRSGGTWGRLPAPTGFFPAQLYNGPDGFEWVNSRSHYIFVEDWIYHGLVGYAGWGTGGSSANIASEAQASGIMGVTTSTSATGVRALTPNSANLVFGEGKVYGQFRVRIPTLSTSGERFTCVVGFIDGESGGTDGAYFRYVDNVAGGNWEAVAESNNSITATDTGVAATTSWTNFTIVVNAAASEVLYYIDGTLVRTETGATIPSGAARATSFGFGIAKSGGTTQRDFYCDVMSIYKKYTTIR